MKDRLEEIFEIQKKFSTKYFAEQQSIDFSKMSDADKKKWNKEFILCASKELYEALDEIKWKQHRFIHQEDNIDNFIEEVVDSFKYILNLLMLNGCNAEKFFQKFEDKSNVVSIRYEQEKTLKDLKEDKSIKLAVLDIDDVLCNSSRHFLDFCQNPYHTIYDFKRENIDMYTGLKYRYRASGQKRNIYPKDEVYKFIDELKKQDYKILLLSARPIEKIIRIYADTLAWLEESKIIYDYLFFSKNKEQFIIDNFSREQIKFCVDDQIDNVNKLCIYFKTYLLPNRLLYTNEDIAMKVKKEVTIIQSFNDIKI